MSKCVGFFVWFIVEAKLCLLIKGGLKEHFYLLVYVTSKGTGF